jgi:hypothetical protein
LIEIVEKFIQRYISNNIEILLNLLYFGIAFEIHQKRKIVIIIVVIDPNIKMIEAINEIKMSKIIILQIMIK